jgi:hypothetical protein
VRGESVGAVIRYTTENAERFFRFFARMAQAG